MLGATTREIAPDAVLAVHSPRVVVHFRGAGTPTPQMRVAATERGMERADRMLQGYIAKMGAEAGLLDLARTIKFEDMHVLTREEIARFGIDRREVVETPWIFESSRSSMVRKTITQRSGDDNAYRMSQWRLFCFNTEQFELDFQRPAVTVVDVSDGPDFERRFGLAVFQVGAGQDAGIRNLGPAHDQGVASGAGQRAAIRSHRDVAGAGRTPAVAQGQLLQRRTDCRAGPLVGDLSAGKTRGSVAGGRFA